MFTRIVIYKIVTQFVASRFKGSNPAVKRKFQKRLQLRLERL